MPPEWRRPHLILCWLKYGSFREASLFTRWGGRHSTGGGANQICRPAKGGQNFFDASKKGGQKIFDSWKRGAVKIFRSDQFFKSVWNTFLNDFKVFWPHSVFGPKGGHCKKFNVERGGIYFFAFDLGGANDFLKFIFFNFFLHIHHHGPSHRSYQGDSRHLRQLLYKCRPPPRK